MKKIRVNTRVLWSLAAILIALLTVRLVIGFSGGMSMQDFLQALRNADPFFLSMSLLFMLGFLFFEGEADLCICRSIGYVRPHRRGFIYAAADTYFSAITPSATGGQPASAFFMIRDGIPAATVTAALVFNLIMYTLAAMCNGLVCILLRPAYLLHFSPWSKLLIGIGLLVLTGMCLLFYFVMKKRKLIPLISEKIIAFLHRIHLVRQPEKRMRKIEHMTAEYGKAIDMMTGRRRTVLLVFLFNLLQRICQILVTVSMYLALGGKLSDAWNIYVTQSMVVLGSNAVPIPGSMGVTDYLMLDGFMKLMTEAEAFRLEFLSRGVYFYLCVLFSGVVVLLAYAHMKLTARKLYRS